MLFSRVRLSKRVLPAAIALALVAAGTGCTTLGIRVDPNSDVSLRRETVAMFRRGVDKTNAALALLSSDAVRKSADERFPGLIQAAKLALEENNQPIYNAAVAQIFELAANRDFKNLPPGLVIDRSGKSILDPELATQLTRSSSVRIKGLISRSVQDGWGTPYVAWFRRGSAFLAKEPGVPPGGMAIPVTAFVTFQGKNAHIRLQQTLQSDKATLAKTRVQLAADFSAPIAILLSRSGNRSIDIASMFLSGQRLGTAGLFQFQPYEPQKIPVVFVHGLISRPAAWTQAVNQLLANPEIRKKYEFWFFMYPTGLPVWKSAAILRSELDRYHAQLEVHGRIPTLDRMVLVGHSMGGIISSLLIREGGPQLWNKFSDVPVERLNVSPKAHALIRETLYFTPRKDVERVVFMNTPHRGSNLATKRIVDLFAQMIQLPINAFKMDRVEILAAVKPEYVNLFSAPANSLRVLRANSPFLLAILSLPADASIPFHSIIGDRGRGDTPNSSDGVVPYWSSHLNGAVTESIIPSGHGGNENPQGIRDLEQILLKNARN